MRRYRPILLVGMSAALLGVLLVGCGTIPGQACSAIGWINQVDVRLGGSESAMGRVAAVGLADDADCAVVSSAPTASTAAPNVMSSPCTGTKIGPGEWRVSLSMSSPTNATITAYSADGSALGTTSTPLEWTRVGGTEQCGGPQTAGPVVLDLAG